jgi:hypothetical protein
MTDIIRNSNHEISVNRTKHASEKKVEYSIYKMYL